MRGQVALACLFLAVLYALTWQTTWSLDGVLHTLNSVRPADEQASGHLLLRGVAWAWTSALALVTPMGFPERYNALAILFAGFGITSLVLLFRVALLRSGPAAAWIALAAVAMSRDAQRQIAALDEKPLGMVTLAVAVAMTERSFRRVREHDEPPTFVRLLPVAMAWMLAAFGHLQSVPFAFAAMATLPFPRGDSPTWPRRVRLLAALVAAAVVGALALFALLYAADGGLSALPRIVHHLLVERAAPTEHLGLVARIPATLTGCVKAFFFVDRLTPRPMLWLALAGTGSLALALALGAWRSRDPLGRALAIGSLALIAIVPAANYFPDYGDSYTLAVIAALVLLAMAPPRWLLAAAAFVWVVNLPAAWDAARPEVTMQRHLERLVETQQRFGAPWVLVRELTPFPLEQGLAPAYYQMSDRLPHEVGTLDALPGGRFLLELPQPIELDGRVRPGRVETVQQMLAARGRSSQPARLWDPPRTIRSDFRRYGDYLVVEPAPPR